MTIGIGKLCEGGAIIAADTMTVYTDGSTTHTQKVRIKNFAGAAIVCAFAASDVRAMQTLVDDIFDDFNQSNLTTLHRVEEIVRSQMVKWSASHPHGAPSVEFIFGASLPTGLGMYHCEPPNAMSKKPYIAIGQGASIVDPVHKMLFRNSPSQATTVLKQFAYLMYRAKFDYASVCGGLTDAIFLRSSPPEAIKVAASSMSHAERSGISLDLALRDAISAILASNRTMKFCTESRQQIEDDGTLRELPPPELC